MSTRRYHVISKLSYNFPISQKFIDIPKNLIAFTCVWNIIELLLSFKGEDNKTGPR
jgi:hypothetical protein